MKRSLLILLMASPLAAFAASNPDESFFKNAAQAGTFEIDAGKMAQEKGSRPEVKDFGAMMVKDHSAAADKLKSLATTKNIDLPAKASVAQMATQAKLEVLSGDTFDRSYIKSQLKAHRQAVALFHKESTSGQDADAKAFAKETLPTLRAHLKSITGIAKGAGVPIK